MKSTQQNYINIGIPSQGAFYLIKVAQTIASLHIVFEGH